MLNRRQALGLVGGGLLAQRPRRPNVIVILTDDQGYGDLSLHGNDKLATPHIDSLARDGAQLTRFHCSPVCSPTRSSLLTGRYNYRTGIVDTYLGRSMMRPGETTIAEMLKPAGYRTGIFGKWHLGDNYPLRPMDQGFDESLVLNGGGLLQPGDPPEELTGVKPSYFNPLLTRNGKWEQSQGYCTDVYFREAMQFIAKPAGRPFFCYVATNAPHTPLQVEEALVKPFLAKGLDETTAKIYAMVENIDQNVGKLLSFLKEKNLEQDTMVVFLTDNGPQQRRYNAGMRALKGSVYEGGTRVPCLVRWPAAVKAGTTVDRVAAHIDWTPTILEATGARTTAQLDGRSLLPLLRDPEASKTWSNRTLFLQWHRGDAPEKFKQAAVLTQRYKLVNGTELYDIEADPAEKTDIAARDPGVVRQLRDSYESWFADVGKAGYAPPRIVISKIAPTLLTRQDWRGAEASWDTKGRGHWEVQTAFAGPYDVTLLFPGGPEAGKLEATWLGSHAIAAGQTRLDLKAVKLPIQREARFEATLTRGGAALGIHYAYFKP
jgi:arylsulfatase A-like enzyme